ncbi:MAG TPA: DALR domain-containing protein, partial [Desulfobaccales bacterium]|nr:DALR domain-containing protein [Desulfobaccales bacterium]
RYWLHHGLLTIDQEKMSKSLKNFFTVKEVLARFPAEVVRFFLINCHYRSPLDFSDGALAEAETALLRLYACLARIQVVLRQHPGLKPQHPLTSYPECLNLEERHRLGSLRDRFDAAMDDDFNTAQALGYLFEAVRLLNRLLEAPSSDPNYLSLLREMQDELLDLGGVLNLLQADPQAMVTTLRQKAADLKISPEEIEQLIQERTQARKNKDWATADRIRKQLAEQDVLLEDTPRGTVWRVKG